MSLLSAVDANVGNTDAEPSNPGVWHRPVMASLQELQSASALRSSPIPAFVETGYPIPQNVYDHENPSVLPGNTSVSAEPSITNSPLLAGSRIVSGLILRTNSMNQGGSPASSSTTHYSYPVATMLRDFVRTSLSNTAAAPTAVADLPTNDDTTLPLSVRSEDDMYLEGIHHQSRMPSMDPRQARSLDSVYAVVPPPPDSTSLILGDEEEYIVVDGDLIAVTPSDAVPSRRRHSSSNMSLQEQILQSNHSVAKTCQPKKMRRGIRKLSKFFRRSRKKEPKNVDINDELSNQPIELSLVENAAPIIQSSSLLEINNLSIARMDGSQSPTRRLSQSKPKAKKEKKLRWGRRKQDPNSMEDSLALASGAFSTTESVEPLSNASVDQLVQDIEPINDVLSNRRRLQSVELPVTTGLEPPSAWGDRDENRAYAERSLEDGIVQPGTPSRHPLNGSPNGSRTTSVTASYVGTAELLLNNADGLLLPDTSVAVVHEEDVYDDSFLKWDEDDESSALPLSLIPQILATGDLKVDNADAPDVEAMLLRAVYETGNDLDGKADSDSLPARLPLPNEYLAGPSSGALGQAKNDHIYEESRVGMSVPLSCATLQHTEVHNDTLKVVMVSASSVDKSWIARRLRSSNKRPRARTTLAVDVHEWQPPFLPTSDESTTSFASPSTHAAESRIHPASPLSPVKCTIWDVQGATSTLGSTAETRSNFGAHPGTQSLFFSPQSLYLLCWDLGCNNTKTNRVEPSRDDDDSDFDEDEDDEDYEDDFIREEANRQADRALHADIVHRVLSWFDCIARCGPKSAILPVALVSEGMTTVEVKRRCDMMRIVLEDHLHRLYNHDNTAPKLLTGTESSILCVNNFGDAHGIQQLQEMVGAIANDPSNSVFDHVGTSVPHGTVLVREAIQKFKEEHKLILLDHLLGDLGNALELHEVVKALQFLACIGEILYFGTNDEDVLSRYIILSRKWLVSALSCILRNDLKRELVETRRFMNMQCIYSDEKYEENEITAALVSGKSSSCPLLSDEDAKMLWQSMSFMREASDRNSNLMDRSTTIPTVFYFLERLLVHAGVFLPLGASQPNASLDASEVFFVPSLLSQADPTNLWTYMTTESWMTTLCHSWLFRDGAPPNLMEHVTVRILRDLYDWAQRGPLPHLRVHSAPVRHQSWEAADPVDTVVGRVRIHHVVCFQSSMLVKIGTVFADDRTGNFRESFVEVFVAVVDQTSAHTVASDVMRPCMQRIVVSGKGQVGHHGHKLWQGGYKIIMESVQNSLTLLPNLDAQTICPECLATGNSRMASTWGWDVVLAAAQSGNPHVICLRGHRVNSHLICGTIPPPERKTAPSFLLDHTASSQRVSRNLNIKDALPGVVLVGVWDPNSKSIISIGSGCIVDKKAGFIVTAGHVIFNMENHSERFGQAYYGCPGARAVVAVIPDRDRKHAVFRYFAEIVASDVRNVDACVLQIRSRLEKDVDDTMPVGAIDQPERKISLNQMPAEDLRSLRLTKHFDLAEPVRLLGYSQEGEGIFEMGKHISPSVEFVEGRIRRCFKAQLTDDCHSDSSSTTTSQPALAPREEIVLDCLVHSGHSGGPGVNGEGKVVGILSRSDPGQRNACYLVPTSEIRPLLLQARAACMPRPARITNMQTM